MTQLKFVKKIKSTLDLEVNISPITLDRFLLDQQRGSIFLYIA